MTPPTTAVHAPRPPLVRASDGRLVAGVARGLAEHLGLPTVWVRVGFVLLALAGGAGLLMYGAFWVLVPLRRDAAVEVGSPQSRDRELLVLLGIGAVAVGVVALGDRRVAGSVLLVPLMVAAVGVAVLWRQSDDAQRDRWRDRASRAGFVGGRAGWVRVALGVTLVVVGVAWAAASTGDVVALVDGLAAGIVLVAGLLLVVGPFLLRLWRELADERRERIRSQERAEVAAHVHDSVLQTLTLIQRHAQEPQTVTRLARAEERALRSWLYRADDPDAGTFVAALEVAAAETEDAYAATVDVVAVGDCPVDEHVTALVQAAREAMVNAAKHAGGAGPVAVYAEVTDQQVEVYVRDRGPGFDVDSVPEDRLGLRQSIIGRMDRHGGRAVVRSGADGTGGTEVSLVLPRSGAPADSAPATRAVEVPVAGGMS